MKWCGWALCNYITLEPLLCRTSPRSMTHVLWSVASHLFWPTSAHCRLLVRAKAHIVWLDSLTSHNIEEGESLSIHHLSDRYHTPFFVLSFLEEVVKVSLWTYEEIWGLEERSLLELDPRELLGFTHVKKTSMMITPLFLRSSYVLGPSCLRALGLLGEF